MKNLILAIWLYQICGNHILYVKDGQPYLSCNTINYECEMLNEVRMIMFRETATCTRLKKFNIME